MNIYLDTTELFNDPWLISANMRILRKALKMDENSMIFISSVVIEEVINHYKDSLEKSKELIENEISKLNKKLQIKLEVILDLEIEEETQKLKDYYISLDECNEIQIIDYSNEILPELVKRSINRIKPFTDTKQEFRDTIIWLSYCEIANKYYNENHYLITNNVRDFYNSNKDDIHEDLRQDSILIKVMPSIKKLIQLRKDEIDRFLERAELNTDLEEKLSENPITEAKIKELVTKEFIDEINTIVGEHFGDGEYEYFSGFILRKLYDESIRIIDFEIIGYDNIYYEIINDEVALSGLCKVKANLGGDELINGRAIEGREYSTKNELNVILSIPFDMILDDKLELKYMMVYEVVDLKEIYE